MTPNQLRQSYLDFFSQKEHSVIPSASLIPENDPTVLFITAGMQPLVPFLLGEAHPAGSRLVDVQKCIRTGDIDDVGDNTHLTFFEMLGNWSLQDYFKNDSITWSFEFLTKVLNLPLEKLAFTVFAGEEGILRDEDLDRSFKIVTPGGAGDGEKHFLAGGYFNFCGSFDRGLVGGHPAVCHLSRPPGGFDRPTGDQARRQHDDQVLCRRNRRFAPLDRSLLGLAGFHRRFFRQPGQHRQPHPQQSFYGSRLVH